MAMAHVDPVRHFQRVIAFAVRAEDAGIDVVDPLAEMVVQVFVEVVVPLDGAGIEDGEIIGLLAVLQAAHQRALLLLLLAQPDGREMNPVVNHVFEAGPVQGLLDRIMLFPKPLARLALDGTPGDVIFVGDQPQVLQADLRVHRGRRLEKSGRGKAPVAEAVSTPCGLYFAPAQSRSP